MNASDSLENELATVTQNCTSGLEEVGIVDVNFKEVASELSSVVSDGRDS